MCAICIAFWTFFLFSEYFWSIKFEFYLSLCHDNPQLTKQDGVYDMDMRALFKRFCTFVTFSQKSSINRACIRGLSYLDSLQFLRFLAAVFVFYWKMVQLSVLHTFVAHQLLRFGGMIELLTGLSYIFIVVCRIWDRHGLWIFPFLVPACSFCQWVAAKYKWSSCQFQLMINRLAPIYLIDTLFIQKMAIIVL